MFSHRTLLTGLLTALAVLLPARGQSLSDIRKEHEETLRQIQQTQKALDSNKNTISNMLYKYNALNAKVKSSENLLTAITREYQKTTRELQQLNSEYAQLEKELKERRDEYAQMVRQIYIHLKDRDKLTFIFSGKDFAQSLRRVRYLNEYARYEEKKAKEIQQKQGEMEVLRKELEVKRSQQGDLVREQQEERNKLREERTRQDRMVREMRKKNSQLNAELKKQRQKAARLNDMIDRFIAEENKKSSAGDGVRREAATQGGYAMTVDERKLSDEFGRNRGMLPFPVNRQGNIVVHFGQDKHNNMKYVQNNSNGIDIVTTPGASAQAVFKGTVSKVFALQGANYSIIVRHGNYLTVYSGLAEVKVSSGQTVRTGQELGTIYVDKTQGDKTLLHFQVRLDKEKLDPEGWLKRN